MFNSKFNLTEALFDLPLNIRKKVMYSMVGSANARIFNAADKITAQMTAEGYEADTLKMLTQPELVALTSSVDDTDSLAVAKVMAGTAMDWRKKLQADTERDDEGSIDNTIKFMIGKQKMRSASQAGIARLAAIGIVPTAEQKLAVLKQNVESAQASADEKTKRLGFTQFIIDRLISNNGGDYSELPMNVKETLCQKFIESLDKAEATATANELLDKQYADALTATDIIMIRDIKAQHVATIFQLVKPLVPRDTSMPGPDAVRVRPGTTSREEQAAEMKYDDSVKAFIANYQVDEEGDLLTSDEL